MRTLSGSLSRIDRGLTAIFSSRGFTIIEVMVAVVIAAVVMAVAVPSMRGLIESNRMSTEINDFVGDLQFARAEAIKQGLPVVLCASSDGKNCSKQNLWHAGWIVFADADNTQTRDDAKEPALRVRPAWKGSDTFKASPATDSFTFSRDGFARMPSGAGDAVLMTLRTATADTSAQRCVSLNRVGHPTVQRGAGACS